MGGMQFQNPLKSKTTLSRERSGTTVIKLGQMMIGKCLNCFQRTDGFMFGETRKKPEIKTTCLLQSSIGAALLQYGQPYCVVFSGRITANE